MNKVLGVIVKELDDKIFYIKNELKILNLLEQMGYMLYNANAFITLPNGLETLEKISSIAYWIKLNFY